MPADRDDRACLWDMLTAARAVQTFVEDRAFEDYVADLMLRSAVERQLKIIGEAARRVSKPFQDAHLEIPWAADPGPATRSGARIRRDQA
jgi:uncharacterized protein with HEPN domain